MKEYYTEPGKSQEVAVRAAKEATQSLVELLAEYEQALLKLDNLDPEVDDKLDYWDELELSRQHIQPLAALLYQAVQALSFGWSRKTSNLLRKTIEVPDFT